MVLAILSTLWWVFSYSRLASKIDRELLDGPFAASTDILASPRTIRQGEPGNRGEILRSLAESGYTRAEGSSGGWFRERAGGLEIYPGSQSIEGAPVRVEFADGTISSIRTLAENRELPVYQLDPLLMANLSETRERRRLVRFEEIPAALVQAVVSVEDKRFFRHVGFDFPRMLKAAYVDLRDWKKSEGASTLTMQLARSLWLGRDKRWGRKFEEILITSHLEHKLTKQQIFEYYANQVYLGQNGSFSINGFGEGARAYFGKDLSQLSTAEAATLAGLIRRPVYYNPFRYPDRALGRRNQVLALMRRNGYLSEGGYQDASAQPLNTAREPSVESDPYFIAVLNGELRDRFGEGRNRCVYTSLEPQLQQAAEAAVQSGMALVDQQLRKRGSHPAPGQPQVALIALDPHTGEIKALVGGRDYSASQLNHVLARRQPGSVFKPFVYAAAIATAVEGGRRVFTPASTLHDEATTFSDGANAYQPRNFHDGFMGDVSLRTALSHSLNVATVSLAQQVGYQQVVNMARRAGWNGNIQPTPSVALGAYEATPLEMAGAYTMFANHGTRVTPTTISMIRGRDGAVLYRHTPELRPVLDPRVAYVMVNLMEEVLRSGTGAGVRSRGFTLPAAGKTGTSRDGWFVGFTDELLCVVWVGYDDNRDLNLEGAKSALPIWAEFMRRAAQIREYSAVHPFQPPQGVIMVQLCSETGLLATPDCPQVRGEVFISGSQPGRECDLHTHSIPEPEQEQSPALPPEDGVDPPKGPGGR